MSLFICIRKNAIAYMGSKEKIKIKMTLVFQINSTLVLGSKKIRHGLNYICTFVFSLPTIPS